MVDEEVGMAREQRLGQPPLLLRPPQLGIDQPDEVEHRALREVAERADLDRGDRAARGAEATVGRARDVAVDADARIGRQAALPERVGERRRGERQREDRREAGATPRAAAGEAADRRADGCERPGARGRGEEERVEEMHLVPGREGDADRAVEDLVSDEPGGERRERQPAVRLRSGPAPERDDADACEGQERQGAADAVHPLEPRPLRGPVARRRERELGALARERRRYERAVVRGEGGERGDDRRAAGEREARGEASRAHPERDAERGESKSRVEPERRGEAAQESRRHRPLAIPGEAEGDRHQRERRQRLASGELEVEAGDERERAEEQRDREGAAPSDRRGETEQRREEEERADILDPEPQRSPGDRQETERRRVARRRRAQDPLAVVEDQAPSVGQIARVAVGDVPVVVGNPPEAPGNPQGDGGEQEEDQAAGMPHEPERMTDWTTWHRSCVRMSVEVG